MNLAVIFLTGLTTGGLSCLAVQGGLLASVISNQKKEESSHPVHGQDTKASSFDQLDWLPVTLFLIAKLVAHLMLGFMLGLLGSYMTLSLEIRIAFTLFAIVYMFATAMNLLNVHPIFRHVVIQPPKFIQRKIRNTTKSEALFTPAILGFLTIFIPCGVTQAMAILAMNSASPIQGALIMGVFVLGTMPLFALIGIATAKLSEIWYTWFTRIAAVFLIAMSIYSLNGILVALDSPVSAQKVYASVRGGSKPSADSNQTAHTQNGAQLVDITIENAGYTPDYFQVHKGIPVKMTLYNPGVYSCASAFVFREFGISTYLKPGQLEEFEFTPTQPGRYTFACSMGMYYGVMEVI